MLVGLPGELVSRQIVPFAMRRGCGRVGVGCQVLQFRGPIVRAL
jgi:hypothetical protein